MASSSSYDKHRELVNAGADWLSKSCLFVVTEFQENWVDRGTEIPDVFGVGLDESGDSCLIECKRTRSDFQNDKKKPFRHNGGGVGNYCYYLCPHGVLQVSDLPVRWGLLYLEDDGSISVIKEPDLFNTKLSTMAERDMFCNLAMTFYMSFDDKLLDKIVAAGLDTELDERESAVSFRLWMGNHMWIGCDTGTDDSVGESSIGGHDFED